MTTDSMGRAQPMMLINTVNGETLEAQFNPESFEESLGVNWARQTVPGLSHQVKQFVHTEDVQIPLDLFYHAAVSGSGPSGSIAALENILRARRFLYASCHPATDDWSVHGSPPRLLFVWPGFISLTCVMVKLKFKYTRFNKANAPVAYLASLQMEEIRDAHVTMNDILEQGTLRSSAGPEGGR